MKLIGLAELARRTGLSRKTLLTRLRALESERGRRGHVLVQSAKGKRVWVKAWIYERMMVEHMKAIEADIAVLRADHQVLELRVENLETR